MALYLRRLSTTTASTISAASARNKLLKTFDPDAALSVLSSAPTSSSSSRFAVDLTVRRLARSRRFADIDSLLLSRLNSTPPPDRTEPFLSTLILTYGTASMHSNARNLFDQIPQPTVISFNALLSAQIKSKKPHFVPQLFSSLPTSHPSITPDEVSYGILIKSFCLSNKTHKALEAFEEMKMKDMKPTMIIYTTLIDSFYKKGRPEEAGRMWEEMVGSGIKPDLAAYNVKAMYPATNGRPEEVAEVMREMERDELEPDAISYCYLVTCYCKSGRFEEAKEAYGEFRKKRIEPNAAIYKVLVQLLCNSGDFDGGLEVARDSMKSNKIPDFRTMSGLVEGLMKSGKVEEAKEVIGVAKERFPDSLLGGWKNLEKRLSLSVDTVNEVPEPVISY